MPATLATDEDERFTIKMPRLRTVAKQIKTKSILRDIADLPATNIHDGTAPARHDERANARFAQSPEDHRAEAGHARVVAGWNGNNQSRLGAKLKMPAIYTAAFSMITVT
jgi:hypothetical protein